MTAITITPRNRKELLALKHFIKALDLPYNETIPEKDRQNTYNLAKKEFEKKLENSYSLDEFSQKTTSFLESLSWKK